MKHLQATFPISRRGATTARRHERRGDVKHLQATFPISRQRAAGRHERRGDVKHLQATFPISRAAATVKEAQEEGRRETSTSHIPNIAAGGDDG